jgi:two-component system, sensor histidine kinase and response regulator
VALGRLEPAEEIFPMISVSAALTSSYDYGEVARSVFIAIVASYAALDLTGRVTVARGQVLLPWLAGGAVAMGIGIWEMHFKGMLALHLPVPVEYHWPTVLLSLLVAALASAVALYVAGRRKMRWVEALTGSTMMSAGIAGMHYIGMAAMRLPAVPRYSPFLVTCSILLAILFSLVALLMAFDLREETKWTVPRRLGSATVMGVAVSAMHYTGMAAATFISSSPPNLSHAVSISAVGNNATAIVTMILLLTAMVTSSVDRRANAEVERINQNLERRVAERTRQLTAINEKLRKEIADRQRVEEALQESQAGLAHATRVLSMGELVTSIAHEVNQPLTAIVTNGNFALRQLDTETPNLKELREAIAEIVEDATRASTVISRIRALLKKGTPDRVELDVNELIQEVANLVRNEATRNRISVELDLAPDLPPILGDRVQLQQVLLNLIMNGIDAMGTTTDQPRELVIKSIRKADVIAIQVQDSGKGFEPGQTDRIFEPFFTTKRAGIGLGLSISRSIIESHGGRLRTVPSPSGALFEFTLPTDGAGAL